jgi:hypothetical protein
MTLSRAPRPAQLTPLHARVLAGQLSPHAADIGEAGFRPGTPPGRLANVLGQHTRSVGSVIVLWRQFRLGSSSGK